MHVLTRESSDYNDITVYEMGELYGETGRFRCLKFADDAVQGAIDLRRPERVLLGYQRAVIGLLDELCPELGRVFVIGHGIGTIARHYANRHVVVAEIDRMVVELSRRYFGYVGDNVILGDGKEVLAQQVNEEYDAIVLDAFTQDGTPRSLTTASFFGMVAEKLAPGGVLVCNLFGRSRGDKRIGAVYAGLSAAFAHVAAYGIAGDRDEGNLILIGGRTDFEAAPREIAGYRPVTVELGFAVRD